MRSPSSQSARQRRHRARLKAGQVVAPVEVSMPVIEALIDLHWLPVEVSEDRKQIAKAIASILDEMAVAIARRKA